MSEENKLLNFNEKRTENIEKKRRNFGNYINLGDKSETNISTE